MVFLSTFISKTAELQSGALLASNPLSNFATLFKGWDGPGKLLVSAAAGLMVIIWSAAHSTGGEGAKRKAKDGWLAAGTAVLVAYAAVSVLSFLSAQSTKSF
ncbi:MULTISPECIES: hypothetical protein [Pediococcus]|uniref:hypothetical protein n=1 Tax=Pediococcus TaxID=1253 RepID=UPI00070A2452|nr:MULTISPECIES: hypothetical protein [Pediococcus]AVL00177.1 hypothetical protein PI20285_05720 [Pediococcus inopinatus]KRN61812.1 hypothetical protein IV83_GL000517 [Pediococcus inopinatus]PIO80353.1 hypothetical protein BSQ38_01080 [Pediococcus damnosus]